MGDQSTRPPPPPPSLRVTRLAVRPAKVEHVVVEGLRLGVALGDGKGVREQLADEAQVRRRIRVVKGLVKGENRARATEAVAREPELIHGVHVDDVKLH